MKEVKRHKSMGRDDKGGFEKTIEVADERSGGDQAGEIDGFGGSHQREDIEALGQQDLGRDDPLEAFGQAPFNRQPEQQPPLTSNNQSQQILQSVTSEESNKGKTGNQPK